MQISSNAFVRAIADGSQDDLERLAQKVVESERQTGHTKLADQLEGILKSPRTAKHRRDRTTDSDRSLKVLPLSRRHGELLATVIPRDAIEHHMVVPAATEERFARIERRLSLATSVASEDIALTSFQQKLNDFVANITGSANVARIHELRDDPTQEERLRRILSDTLFNEWPTIDDQPPQPSLEIDNPT